MEALISYFPKKYTERTSWIALDDKVILNYSKRVISDCKEKTSKEFMWNEFDCLANCYSCCCESTKVALQLVRTFLLQELRLSFSTVFNDDAKYIPARDLRKTCTCCKKVKHETEFYTKTDTVNGALLILPLCKVCYCDKYRESKKAFSKTPEQQEKSKQRQISFRARQKAKSLQTIRVLVKQTNR